MKRKNRTASSSKSSIKFDNNFPVSREVWNNILKTAKNNKISLDVLADAADINLDDDSTEFNVLQETLLTEGIEIVDPVEGEEVDEEEISIISSHTEIEPLQIYIQDINRIPLLNAEKEIEEAKTILKCRDRINDILQKAGISSVELKKYLPDSNLPPPPMKGHDRRTLAKQAKALVEVENQYAESQRILIESNLRLVVSIAKKYIFCGLHLLDLINEGNLGLIKAVERFDYRLGYKFSTYASWWIRQSIRRAIADQGRLIRVPIHVSDSIHRWIKVTRALSQKLGREPSLNEIAKEMGLPEPKLLDLVKASKEPSSLETAIPLAQEASLSEIIEDTAAISPYKSVLSLVFTEYLDKILSTLQDKERKIIEMRFGLFGQPEKTLEEIGTVLDITRERVRQLELRALKKLRHLRLSEELYSMMVEMEH